MPNLKSTLPIFLVFISFCGFSQTDDVYSSLFVPVELKIKANAVVRHESRQIIINDYDDMVIRRKRIVTIYNKEGVKHANAYEHYSEDTKIKNIEIKIFDNTGEEIKKIRKNDFTDASAVSGGTLYSDDRVLYYDYTPINFPFTIEFKSEVHLQNTSYIPQWMPIDGYYLSVKSFFSSIFRIKN